VPEPSSRWTPTLTDDIFETCFFIIYFNDWTGEFWGEISLLGVGAKLDFSEMSLNSYACVPECLKPWAEV